MRRSAPRCCGAHPPHAHPNCLLPSPPICLIHCLLPSPPSRPIQTASPPPCSFFDQISQDTGKFVFGVKDTLACLVRPSLKWVPLLGTKKVCVWREGHSGVPGEALLKLVPLLGPSLCLA